MKHILVTNIDRSTITSITFSSSDYDVASNNVEYKLHHFVSLKHLASMRKLLVHGHAARSLTVVG